MKRSIVITVALAFALSAFSQGITSKDRFISEIHWNYWLNSANDIQPEWYSRGANFSIMYDLELGESPFSIAPGIGFGFDNVYHNGYFAEDSAGTTQLRPYDDTIDYKRNKLSTVYLDVPLELRFRTKPNDKGNSFKIALGAKGGFLIANYTKYIGEGEAFGAPADDAKYKEYNVPNISTFRYGLTARIGYGPVNLSAFYSLSPLFDQDLGPQLTPISIGVSFNGL